MSYADRDIAGHGICTPEQLRESLVKRGRYLASQGDRWAPGGIYREPLEGIEHIIIEECERYPGFEVNADGVTVQINIETAGLQSLFWIERANPGGIGAIDSSPGDALWFTRDDLKPDGREIPFAEAARRGIRAMIAKLLNYRFGEGPWTADDPRAFAIRLKRWMGSCITFADLQGKWATSATYAATIDSVWTALAAIPGGSMATPYDHVISGLQDIRHLLKRNPNGGSEGRMALSQKHGAVIHFNGPDVSATDDREFIIDVIAPYHASKDFSRAGDGSAIGDGIMYHVGIGRNGEKFLMRDLEAGLWHSGSSWNTHSLALFFPIGINQRATPAALRAAWEVLDDWRRFTKGLRGGVLGHQELSSTNCPGTLMADLVRPYRIDSDAPVIVLPGPAPSTPGAQLDPWRFDEAAKNYARDWNAGEPFWVLNPFVDWLHLHGGLSVMGYVTSGAFIEDGLLVQYFEGGRLEWHPGNPPEHRVLRGHTGLEVLRARHPERVPA